MKKEQAQKEGAGKKGGSNSPKAKDGAVKKKEKSIKINNTTNNSQNQGSSSPQLKRQESIPRNVQEYSHFLQHQYITEQDINWVLMLRKHNNELTEKLLGIPNQAFSVFDKPTKTIQNKKSIKDLSVRGSIGSVEHLIRHRIGGQQLQGSVDYEATLRSYSKEDKTLQQKEKGWSSLPKIERHQPAEFLPDVRTEIEMKKEMKKSGKFKQIAYNILDGYLSYPKFNEKMRERNIAYTTQLCTPDKFLTTISWEVGLRNKK